MFRGMLRYLLAVWCLAGVLCASDNAVWLDVPFVKQEKNGCGAASIAMVMQYWQRQQGQAPVADASQVQRALYSPPAHGIYASDLEKYSQEHGFQTFAFRGQWDDLKVHLPKGRPLIVALKPGRGLPLHYVVLVGVNGQQGFVLKNDPAERKLLKQPRSEFEKEWKAAGNWTLLALPQNAQASAQPPF
jgi:ABC-type bacteriocin/lantibiotic exporter with double-glycine peptidase domain